MVESQEGWQHGRWAGFVQRSEESQSIGQTLVETVLMKVQVKKVHVQQRENPIVNRLNKTRVEKFPDLRKEKDDYLRAIRKKDQEAQRLKVSASPYTEIRPPQCILTAFLCSKRRIKDF